MGMSSTATCRLGLTVMLIGRLNWPEASALCSRSFSWAVTGLAVTSSAWTATTAGTPSPGNAAWIRS